MNLWLVIIVAGLITYAIRLSMILLQGRISLPQRVQQGLRYVPVAVLSAIIFPEMLQPGGTLDLSLGNARLLAGIVAVAVAHLTKNVMWTAGVGMLTLWGLQALMG